MGFDTRLSNVFVLLEGSARLYKMTREYLPQIPKRVFDELWDNRFWPFIFKPLIKQAETGKLPPTGPWVSTEIGRVETVQKGEQKERNIMRAFTSNPIVKTLKGMAWGRGGTEDSPGKPEIIKVRPSDFSKQTQEYFMRRNFGNIEIKVRDDWRRTFLQRKIAWSAIPGHNKPVILAETDDGLELLEGWHRAMATLLLGLLLSLEAKFPRYPKFTIVKAVLLSPMAAEQLLKAYEAGLIPGINKQSLEKVESYGDWDFDDWKDVPLLAYVGRTSRVAV